MNNTVSMIEWRERERDLFTSSIFNITNCLCNFLCENMSIPLWDIVSCRVKYVNKRLFFSFYSSRIEPWNSVSFYFSVKKVTFVSRAHAPRGQKKIRPSRARDTKEWWWTDTKSCSTVATQQFVEIFVEHVIAVLYIKLALSLQYLPVLGDTVPC